MDGCGRMGMILGIVERLWQLRLKSETNRVPHVQGWLGRPGGRTFGMQNWYGVAYWPAICF